MRWRAERAAHKGEIQGEILPALSLFQHTLVSIFVGLFLCEVADSSEGRLRGEGSQLTSARAEAGRQSANADATGDSKTASGAATHILIDDFSYWNHFSEQPLSGNYGRFVFAEENLPTLFGDRYLYTVLISKQAHPTIAIERGLQLNTRLAGSLSQVSLWLGVRSSRAVDLSSASQILISDVVLETNSKQCQVTLSLTSEGSEEYPTPSSQRSVASIHTDISNSTSSLSFDLREAQRTSGERDFNPGAVLAIQLKVASCSDPQGPLHGPSGGEPGIGKLSLGKIYAE
jgi:hypothetical protein